MKNLLPWLVASAFAALSIGLWVSRQGEQPVAPAAPDVVTPGRCPDLGPCRRCAERLAVTQTLLDRCRDEPDLAAGTHDCPDVEARVEEVLVRRLEETARRREAARDQEDTAVRHLLTASLGLNGEEARWLTEYVCTVRELRQQALGDLSERDASPDETVRRIEAERTELLGDLEQYLGAERYRRLRDIGGIGLLGDVLQCGQVEAGGQ